MARLSMILLVLRATATCARSQPFARESSGVSKPLRSQNDHVLKPAFIERKSVSGLSWPHRGAGALAMA
jgi:hypothetical protein